MFADSIIQLISGSLHWQTEIQASRRLPRCRVPQLDFAQEAERQIVSVRFTGMVREEAGAEATPFDEVWHLVKPLDDSRNWAIAGIQQAQ